MLIQDKNSFLADPDNRLLLKTGSGDMSAFRLLMEKHQLTVMRMIYRYTGQHHEAEDLAQEIFLKIYLAARHYTPRARFKTWLYKVVANHCLNFHRSQKTHPYAATSSRTLEEIELSPRSPGEGEPPACEKKLEQDEVKTAIAKALSELPDRHRMAVILFRFEGLSYREIAQTLGCSLAARRITDFPCHAFTQGDTETLLQPALAAIHHREQAFTPCPCYTTGSSNYEKHL